ncbi:hypothetical protein F5Y19DRAFT_470616 [Xylariaceae sp. FL1651]|nr:hypothetical protein F5Y19DRAFT_470616 [Xylariaceae sp. FL1651]
MGLNMGNFARDFPIAIGVAAAGTIGVLILVCVFAHCGTRLCGLRNKDRWFESRLEEGWPHDEDVSYASSRRQYIDVVRSAITRNQEEHQWRLILDPVERMVTTEGLFSVRLLGNEIWTILSCD